MLRQQSVAKFRSLPLTGRGNAARLAVGLEPMHQGSLIGRGPAMDHGLIGLLHRMVAKLGRESRSTLGRSSKDQHPARRTIEAVNEAEKHRTRLMKLRTDPSPRLGEQVRVAGDVRLDRNAAGLVDHQNMIITV